jgi:hypothetical protein
MKKIIIATTLASVAALPLLAQTIASSEGQARYQIAYGTGYPGDVTGEGAGFATAQTSFAGGNGSFTRGQVSQYAVQSADYAAFNAATDFSISLSAAPTVAYELWASTRQFGGSGDSFVDSLMDATTGNPLSTHAPAFINGMDAYPGSGAGGNATYIGDFSGGTTTIAGNVALNTLLSGTTFDSTFDSQGDHEIYLFFVSNSLESFESFTPGGSITAVPEPSSYALLAGMLALASIMLRRRG